MAASSSSVNTRPVGLWGLLITIALVFGEKTDRSSSRSIPNPGGLNVTYLGTAPVIETNTG